MVAADFEWDEGNRTHCRKHGMEPAEIEQLFRDGLRVAPSLKHGAAESRFVAIGRTAGGRAAFIVFTMRGDRIRPLSARYMHAKEAARYET